MVWHHAKICKRFKNPWVHLRWKKSIIKNFLLTRKKQFPALHAEKIRGMVCDPWYLLVASLIKLFFMMCPTEELLWGIWRINLLSFCLHSESFYFGPIENLIFLNLNKLESNGAIFLMTMSTFIIQNSSNSRNKTQKVSFQRFKNFYW